MSTVAGRCHGLQWPWAAGDAPVVGKSDRGHAQEVHRGLRVGAALSCTPFFGR